MTNSNTGGRAGRFYAWVLVDCRFGTVRDIALDKDEIQTSCPDCRIIRILINQPNES